MIKYISDENDIIDFILSMYNDEYFSNPMLKTKEQLASNLLRPMFDSNDFVIGIYNDNELIGVFSCIVEPEEKYLELLLAYSKKKEAYLEFISFLNEKYKGYQCDLLINPKNYIFYELLKQCGAIFEPIQKYMVLQYIPNYFNPHEIILYDDEYKDEYLDIHMKDIYWTGEKVIEAKERFRTLLALHNNKVVGYIDFTYSYMINEPYSLFVKEEYRNKGFGKALLFEAIISNCPRGMSLRVDYDNYAAIHIYEQLGFKIDESNDSMLVRLIIN